MHAILIPGFWLGADSWGPVTDAIRAARHVAHPLTLPGQHIDDTDRANISLADCVAFVVDVLDSILRGDAAAEVVIIAHSGGGPIANAVADARPSAVTRIVYVDTVPLPPGMAINAELPVVDGEIPIPDWSLFDDEDLVDLTEELRQHLRSVAVPLPARVASDPQVLTTPERFTVPATVICCEFTSSQLRQWMSSGATFAAEVAQISDLELIELPTGHWPQLTKPHDLAAVITAAMDLRQIGS